MSPDRDSPEADYDASSSAYQVGALEDDLDTQIEDSNEMDNEIDVYDPYSMLEEAPPTLTTNYPKLSNYQAPRVSEDRDERVQHTPPQKERSESPQTSQGPSPTQRSRESTRPFEATSPAAIDSPGSGAQQEGLQNSRHAHLAMTNGSRSPVIKMEEQDEDVCFIKSNTLAEAIIISDDEDMVDPISGNRIIVIDPVQNPSSDQRGGQTSSRTELVNMGNSILRTRTTQRKPTKAQIETMKQAQQMLAKQFNPKSMTGGAGTVFKGTAGQGHVRPGVVHAVKEADAATAIDDNAWMHEEMADDSDDSVNSVIISKLKRTIAGKVKKNQPVLREEVELINAEKKWAIRNRRHRIEVPQEDSGDQNSIFVPEDGNEHKRRKLAREASQIHHSNHNPAENDPDFDTTVDKPDNSIAANQTNGYPGGEPEAEQQRPIADEERVTQDLLMAMTKETNGESETKKPKKKRASVAKTAKEVHQRNRSKVKVTKGPGFPETKTKEGKKTKRSKTSKSAPNKVAEKKKTAKRASSGYGTSGDGSALLMDLLHDNAIQNRMAQGDLGEAPIIGEKKSKDRMLKELIASVPTEHKRHVTNEKKDLLQASKSFGFGKVMAKEGKWLLKGMRSPLYHHQLLGADFMVGRECGTLAPFGGLLADAMGLGKTLQLLATMVGNPPTTQEASVSKITLLVVPSGVIRQWQEEIARHVDDKVFKKIMHYKATKEISLEILQDCDILITSYAEVMNSYPWPDQEEMETLTANTIPEWSTRNWESRGTLHRLRFYRVVLDEAHVIRNYKSRTSIACVNLKADLRWALTGTPILNRLEELYPYFRFLSVNYAPNFPTFKKEFCDPKSEECQRRVLSLLSYMMIRRTLQDKIFDRPIVELPKTHAAVRKIDFSKEERALYQILEDRFRRDFNSYFEAGTTQKNYRNVVVKLLRLRQCTAHPFLLRQTIRDIFTLEDLRNLEARLASANMEKRPIYDRIGLWVKEATADKEGSQGKTPDVNTPAASLDSDGGFNFGKSNFGATFDFAKYLSTFNEKELLSRCICGICADVADEPTITDCKHVFCRDCIQAECNKAAAQSNWTECPVCRSAFDSAVPFEELKAKQDASSPPSEGDGSQTGGKRRRKGNKRSSDPWLEIPGEMLPSAKTVALKQQVLEWQKEAPDDKIVIFTQFHLMARIIAKICDAEEWPYVLYLGDMTPQARHKAVQSFGAPDPELRIMIAGLKCGGQGLNLTMANRVISIDLWWNHSVELQAFGRVFRIGQHKETQLTRLVVRNTVDDRLLKMQDDKLKVVDGVMSDDGHMVKSLSVEDLASLFGFLTRDANGNPVLQPHQDEEAPGDDPAKPSQAG